LKINWAWKRIIKVRV